MVRHAEIVVCRTPNPGKHSKNIARWKYELVRGLILRLVPRRGEGIVFRDLARLVEAALTDDERTRLGSVPWHTTTVKLNMEVEGELARVPGSNPQRLLRRGG